MYKKLLFLLAFLLSGLFSFVTAQRKAEILNRGLVAVKVTSSLTFLSWRLLGNDPDNISFDIYRDGTKINAQPITDRTNFSDNAAGTQYTVKTLLNGVETGETQTVTPLNTNYIDIVLNVPAAMIMPDNSTCTYSPNDCSTGDVDGDGEYEIIVKWDPSNAKDNSQSGYTGNVYIDVYKLNSTHLHRIDLGKNIRAGAHYTQFMVADFDGDGKAEIACKTAPGTKDGKGNFISKGPAATATHTSDYRNSGGYILSGPEYMTVFSGLTGEELATANYNPQRGTVSSWGDSYGNRVDRFLAGIAWLDGVLPSIIMCRGYYTRAVVAAWDYRNGTLTNRWTYDSGNSNVGLYGQGNHNMSVGDVDNDGKDEIIWSSAALDHDGKVLYRTNLGHGDAMHLTDHIPDRKGLELWTVHESTGAAYGEELHDARTGEIIWGTHTGTDNGRGMAGNVIPNNRGFEMWSGSGPGLMSTNGTILSSSKPSMNFRIYWDGDLEDELLDGTTITKWGVGSIFSAAGCSSNNGTKSTPNLSADLFGDWREEVVFRTSDNKKLRIFTTTTPTQYRMYTLMHDAVYRNAVAWQNTAYNQPPHAGFYIGNDMDAIPVSDMYDNEKRWKTGTQWNKSSASWLDTNNAAGTFADGDKVSFDISTGASAVISIDENVAPATLKVNSPYNVTWNGTGKITGSTGLRKAGADWFGWNTASGTKELYFSVLLNASSTNTGVDNGLLMYVGFDNSNLTWRIVQSGTDWKFRHHDTSYKTLGPTTAGVTVFVVGRFTFTSATSTTVDLWFNPTLGAALGTSTATKTTTTTTSGGQFRSILTYNGTNIFTYDEFRMGVTAADVMPCSHINVTGGTKNFSSYNLTITGTATVTSGNELVIDQNTTLAGITVKPGGKLTVKSGVTLNALVTLESSADGTGTLVDQNSLPTLSGTVYQYLPTGRNWYVGIPINWLFLFLRCYFIH